MPSPIAPPAVESLNRLRKALRIAAWLHASEIDSVAVATGGEKEWREVMATLRTVDRSFGCNYMPSAETRSEVVGVLIVLEEAAAMVAARKGVGSADLSGACGTSIATAEPIESKPDRSKYLTFPIDKLMPIEQVEDILEGFADDGWQWLEEGTE